MNRKEMLRLLEELINDYKRCQTISIIDYIDRWREIYNDEYGIKCNDGEYDIKNKNNECYESGEYKSS